MWARDDGSMAWRRDETQRVREHRSRLELRARAAVDALIEERCESAGGEYLEALHDALVARGLPLRTRRWLRHQLEARGYRVGRDLARLWAVDGLRLRDGPGTLASVTRAWIATQERPARLLLTEEFSDLTALGPRITVRHFAAQLRALGVELRREAAGMVVVLPAVAPAELPEL